MSRVIVLDFETTGLSPADGARVTEVGAVTVDNGCIVDSFQSLMNAGVRIPPFIERLTGISNAMIRTAPPAGEVMGRLLGFIGRVPLVAHNASFDRRFLDAELARIGGARLQDVACSVLVARRLYPDAPSYRLAELVRHTGLAGEGVFHRALADATMTARLWIAMQEVLRSRFGLDAAPFELILGLQRVPKRHVATYIKRWAERSQS